MFHPLPPPAVIEAYAPALNGLRWLRVASGFSGASVWRGDDQAGMPQFALKAWPADVTPARLTCIHLFTAKASRHSFVPKVVCTIKGETYVPQGGHLWDVTLWRPGEPRVGPTLAEVEAACVAVAELHSCWPGDTAKMPCPGALNRLRVLNEFLTSPLRVPVEILPPGLSVLVGQARDVAALAAPQAVRLLEPWQTVSLTLQPCVRDLRSDHVLFSGSSVSGIIDFGASGYDHPAVDLARLMSDWELEEATFDAGLQTYRVTGGTSEVVDEFVTALAQASTVCSTIGWLVRVCNNFKFDSPAVETRLTKLVNRVKRIINQQKYRTG